MPPVVLHLGVEYGLVIFSVNRRLLRPERVAGAWDRKVEEAVMIFHIVGAIAAIFLMVYLVIALLKPELFS
jgi:K+-transporting ATPase KdpF subunit